MRKTGLVGGRQGHRGEGRGWHLRYGLFHIELLGLIIKSICAYEKTFQKLQRASVKEKEIPCNLPMLRRTQALREGNGGPTSRGLALNGL